MKIRTAIVLSCLSAFVVLGVGLPGRAQQDTKAPWNHIGVVSVVKVMELSQKNTDFYKKVKAEQNGWRAELQKGAEELKADEVSLQTMRPGSEDYMVHFKNMMLKQGRLEATEKYYNQIANAKGREWTERIYQQVLTASAEVAKEMGLRMVFQRSEPEFPLPNEQALLTAMNTHKLFYFNGPIDITDQVIEKIDANPN